MDFWFTSIVALGAILIGLQCYAKHTPARAFCFLWAAILWIWAILELLIHWWDAKYAATMSYEVLSASIYVEYMLGAALSFSLLHYMRRNNTGFLLIGIPITFYLILGVCVPFEARLFETFYTWELYNAVPIWFALSELFLLVVDQHDNRRRFRRFMANVFIYFYDSNAIQVRNRVD